MIRISPCSDRNLYKPEDLEKFVGEKLLIYRRQANNRRPAAAVQGILLDANSRKKSWAGEEDSLVLLVEKTGKLVNGEPRFAPPRLTGQKRKVQEHYRYLYAPITDVYVL